MRTLLIYEPDHNGHHYSYLARMLPGFVDSEVSIILATTPEGASSKQYDFYLRPFEEHFRLIQDCVAPPRSPLRIAWRRAVEIKKLQKKYAADHVFVAYADGVWQVLAALSVVLGASRKRSYSIEGILYRGDFTYPDVRKVSGQIKRSLFRRLLSKTIFDRLLIDDDYLYDFANKVLAEIKNPITRIDLAVNPIEFFDVEKDEARRKFGFYGGSRVISLSGMIDNRKGAHLLVEAFVAAINDGLRDTVLVLAGPHSEAVRLLLQQDENRLHVECGRIISIDRLLNERDMYSVAAASDVVAAPYPNHSGRSSIVIWAAAAGRPVLGTERGCIGLVIKRESLGTVCDVRDTGLFTREISRVFENPWSEADAARAKAYAGCHTIQNYRTLNAGFMRSKLTVGVSSES